MKNQIAAITRASQKSAKGKKTKWSCSPCEATTDVTALSVSMAATLGPPTTAPKRPQDGTFASSRRGTRIHLGGDSPGRAPRYRRPYAPDPAPASGPRRGARRRRAARTVTAVVPDPVRVLLVDDDALMRAGLAAVLSSDDGVLVVGEAEDGAVALERVRRHEPEVVLMDVRMPGVDGIAATREIVAAAPRPVS